MPNKKKRVPAPAPVPVLPIPAGFCFKRNVRVDAFNVVMNHHVVVTDGVVRYRVWSDSTDGYVTAPLSKEEYWEHQLLNALLRDGLGKLFQGMGTDTFLLLRSWVGESGTAFGSGAVLVVPEKEERRDLSVHERHQLAHNLATFTRDHIKESPMWQGVVEIYG